MYFIRAENICKPISFFFFKKKKMQNETSFNLQQQTELDALSGPPPPYTDEYPPHPTRLPNNLNLSRLAEETLQVKRKKSLPFFYCKK